MDANCQLLCAFRKLAEYRLISLDDVQEEV